LSVVLGPFQVAGEILLSQMNDVGLCGTHCR